MIIAIRDLLALGSIISAVDVRLVCQQIIACEAYGGGEDEETTEALSVQHRIYVGDGMLKIKFAV